MNCDYKKRKTFIANLWNSSSKNALVLLLVNIPVFVVRFESMLYFLFNTSLPMKFVYKLLQKEKKTTDSIRMALEVFYFANISCFNFDMACDQDQNAQCEVFQRCH